ncbi:hypothetical protein [Spiroplasma platyhelix]|uniref:Uncharacterized protein n=1 Tax=Spiroplasma platyhelix PALS-1 TaxID=1276218 RepID=A0A846U9H4_9MOLU|nr:hypothetical protein [Spiroplasma platyhelix]MBE4704152.1 hypothetical protein [Spiroplasma platyhelix PALS-1]NKE38523.1 hypothetical protein [Spiroplasma platyhelix PALS-1]UJB29410.1 hypothetical protein SPLAT_v1c06460 [Spiroplasma platyhelix PALS-1]
MEKENKRDVVGEVINGVMSEPTEYGTLTLVIMWTLGLPLMLLYVIIKYSVKGTKKLVKKIKIK